MPELIVAPELHKAVIERQGIFTMLREDAALECNCPQRRGEGCGGIAIDDIPLVFRTFQLLCQEKAKRFIQRLAARGYEFQDGSDVLVHGPFPSYEYERRLGDAGSPVWAKAMNRDYRDGLEHPERALPFVFERDPDGGFVDYVLVARFLIEDKFTDLEAHIGNG